MNSVTNQLTMQKFSAWLLVLSVLFLSTSCASLKSVVEKPRLAVTDFKLLGTQGLSPRFGIGLKVDNPNRFDLKLNGASYTLSLQGFEVIQGVSNDIPTIPAYGSATFTVEAQASFMEGLKLVKSLMANNTKALGYVLSVKLDAGDLVPTINIKDEGMVEFAGGKAKIKVAPAI